MQEPTSGSALTLWGRANSVNVQKVLWCCEELGLGFERIDAGLHFGRNNEPAYLAMNPTGRVPTLVDNGFAVWESNTVLRYLANKFDLGRRLYPEDPARRSMVDRWLDWTISSYGHVERDLYWGLIRAPADQRDMPALQKIADRLGALWQVVEAGFGDRAYIAGADFSIADICLGAYARRWFGFEGIAQPALPKVAAWHERVAQRPAYRRHLAGPLT